MDKKVPSHLRKKAAKCIFCDEPGLSKTHIWPAWLNSLLAPGTAHWVKAERRDATEVKIKQGSIFSQKPYLACVCCNTGWMKSFEMRPESSLPLFSRALPR